MSTSWNVIAQDNNYIFHNFSEQDGLCDNIIFALHQDQSHIVWIGTQTGLSRFDGKNFYNFKQIHENGKYVSNTVSALCTDKSGVLWGGTHFGIFSLHPETGKFQVFFPYKNGPSNFIVSIFCDRLNNIYAGGLGGICKLNRKTNTFEPCLPWSGLDGTNHDLGLLQNKMILDEENHCFWLGLPKGLYKFDYENQKLESFDHHPNNPLFRKRYISAFSKSQEGTIWFFDNTNQQLVSFDPCRMEEVTNLSLPGSKHQISAVSTLVDQENKIWISDWAFTTRVIDRSKPDQISILENEGKNTNLGSGFFWASFLDENQSVWLGTIRGISVFSSKNRVYSSLQIKKYIPELGSEKINLVEENSEDHSLWITTLSHHIIQYFPGSKKYYIHAFKDFNPNPEGELPKEIYNIICNKNLVHVVTDKGIWQKNTNVTQGFYYVNLQNSTQKLSEVSNAAFAFPYWFVHDDHQVYIWNSIHKKGHWVKNPCLDDNKIFKIFPNADGSFVATTQENYFVFEYSGHGIKIDSSISKALSKSVGYMADAELDKNNRLWVSCKGVGLFMLDLMSGTLKKWSDVDGMADKDLHQITVDHKGRLWGLYWNKLVVFEPEKNIFSNFKIPFSENKLNYFNHLTVKSDGVVMATIGNEIFELDLSRANQFKTEVSPTISSISFSGKEYLTTTNNPFIVRPLDNHVQIKYGLPVDPLSFPHTFEYILEGAEKKWNKSNLAGEITYSNLRSGSYRFKIRALDKNGKWSSGITSIPFIISTPFYQKTWFIILSISGLVLAIWFYYKSKINARDNYILLQSKTHHLEKEKAQMMFDSLKQQLNPHFLFNSLTSLSALIENDPSLAGRFLSQMSDMYRYILKNGDEETVPLKDELVFVETYYQLQKTRFGNGLIVNITVDENAASYQIAPVTLQNMIENAIKHNVIDREEPLQIDIFCEGEYLIIKNNKQSKKNVETSNKKGLHQFQSLYKYLTHLPVIIENSDTHFIIKIPLLKK